MKVYELLSTPEKWCQGAFARDANGQAVWWSEPSAVCWSLTGAIWKCYGYSELDRFCRRVEVLLRYRGHTEGRAKWHESPGRTHAEVLKLAKELDI